MSAQDQIADAVMALHADAVRAHPLVAAVITEDEVVYRGEFMVRLASDPPTP
jgi:hypothetical protein